MTSINLLPWREARRRERKRQFVVSFAGHPRRRRCRPIDLGSVG